MKKLLSIFLAFCLIITAFSFDIFSFAAEEKTSGYYTYLVSNQQATITKVDASISGDIIIPNILGGCPVTNIASNAFKDCDSVTGITLPESVINIGDYAFRYCDVLANLTAAEGLMSIGEGAFYLCSELKNISLPDSVTRIGSDAFYNTAYFNDKENWENNVLYIGNHLIRMNNSFLGSYEIREGTLTIADSAFYGRNNLTGIGIPDTVTVIPDFAFAYCSSLKSVFIPEKVIAIGNYAFDWCTGLTRASIPDSVTSIGDYAFRYCSSLGGLINIPQSVNFIGEGVFYYCDNLDVIDVDENNESYSSIDGILFDKNKTEIITYPVGKQGKNYIIPNSVERISNGAFHNCKNLTKVNIPDGVTTIDEYAFYNCDGLTSVVMPVSITSIGDNAFYSCDALKDIWYIGTIQQKESIEIGIYNDALINAIWHYNACPVGAEHYYDNDCDKDCNVCGGLRRDSDHIYDNVCDADCNVCGLVRTVPEHIYDGKLDEYCNNCNHFRKVDSYGDVNNDYVIDVTDLAVLRSYFANLDFKTGESTVKIYKGADVNGDGKVNSTDLAMLRGFFANMNPQTGESSVALGPKN